MPFLCRAAGRLARRALLALPLLATAAAAPAAAQGTWPERPIRLIVPFPPGGVTDSIARLAAGWMTSRLGQQVVVENRTGAGGAIAAEAAARSRPDGYTLFTASASQLVMLPALTTLSFDPVRDFAPISIIGSNPQVLAVAARYGANTLQDFLALLQRENGRLTYGTAGNGSSNHLAMALLLHRTGLAAEHIIYRGGNFAMQAVLAGDVAAYFGNPIDIMPHAGGPAVRVLGVAAEAPMAALPGVPTIAAQGLPGFRAETWNSIVAPAGTPDAVVQRLADILVTACRDAEARTALERLGTEPVCSTPAEFRTRMAADGPQWRELVQAAGLKLE